MARRRLMPGVTGQGGIPAPAARSGPQAPIATTVADAAGTAALEEMAGALQSARDSGRMILDLPLDRISADHLSRDRIPVEDEEMAALRESLRLHGQRTPIEVTPLEGTALPYGLISGWRRLHALKALAAETGESRFATVQAIIRKPDTVADAYVNMVEENEVRVGLSQYERARVAALATQRGVFPTEKAALLALFASASRAKRSRIRAFLELYHALDGVLRFPTHLPERLGLQLVDAVRAGEAGRIAEKIAAADPRVAGGGAGGFASGACARNRAGQTTPQKTGGGDGGDRTWHCPGAVAQRKDPDPETARQGGNAGAA